MSTRVAIRHITHYSFDRPVSLSPHVIRLRPAPHSRTPIRGYSLNITPEKHFINWQQDPFGNYLARLVFPEKTRELKIDVEVIADMTVINPFDFFVEEYAQHFPFSYPSSLGKELAPYFEIEENGDRLKTWLEGIDRSERGIVDFLVDVNQQLQQKIAYAIRMEPGIQTCEKTLEGCVGSCRDTAWLLVQILRHLGLAARFVSGYLVQLTPDEKPIEGPAGPEEDFTDLHAWAEVYVPGAGWVGLDPTSGLFAGEGHIPLAATPNPASAAPMEGATDKCEVTFAFSNTVTRIYETPRVTKPYSENAWAEILHVGQLVDEHLAKGDVRLTMGGEPTFVSIDEVDAPEWNTAALGEHKRARAEDLWKRLHDKFAPGGLLHAGQGKWYPGEVLPRWALGIYWRKDGTPLWKNPALLAEPSLDLGHGHAEACSFVEMLATLLGIPARFVQPGFEDGLYYLWQEGKVPPDLDPAQADLSDSLIRRSLAEKLSRGLGNPVGYALPLKWDEQQTCFTSGQWGFRRDRMYLAPGDSPMGLRLPLDSLIAIPEDRQEITAETDPFAPRQPLQDFHGEIAARFSEIREFESAHPEIAEQPPADKAAADAIPRTALCIEARQGVLHVFMPPLTVMEHYLSLLAAIETAADKLGTAIMIEGYAPPRDPRVSSLLVTPDPGVIEVNIHPATSWDELVANTTVLYEEARQARLCAEKFMLDGRHTGTGGGCHITLGGATPADSPFLRRPHLLQSLITYWQHHPSLSYMFSGLFVGPTSQAPRADEGRRDQLYELAIAFSHTPLGDTEQPWLVDRLLRNLLVDITGNTHRAEFCIDKLYSPDSPAGRQGLVEFRGFEMPPHPRMNLVQMLLLRALVARFWDTPYRRPLVDWGTDLHDRFMLPHFLWQDLMEVVTDLRDAGFPLQGSWFEPFHEFRFPKLGEIQIEGINLELRTAIEPWYVLGEEGSNQGTARFVDSSMERLQAKITGSSDGRYVLTCNGRRVPLRPTGKQGEQVVGIRYRAWQPPSALHPTIGVHAPLTFDLIDTWNERSIGGCTYHVMHPGGRSYDTFPVNAYEAEARRVGRYFEWGHTPPPELVQIALQPSMAKSHMVVHGGNTASSLPPEEAPAPEFPLTLDLRRPPRLA
jgi:uncharacterized protein (DUF2126 family)/transglutaminase-like putative cysteine protease